MQITTWSGRGLLNVTQELGSDRAWYEVERFGTVTVQWDPEERVGAHLGRWTGKSCWPWNAETLPGLPTLYGVQVHGSAWCTVASEGTGWVITSAWDSDSQWRSTDTWRCDRREQGPPGTRKRATDVAVACARHFASSPEAADLLLNARILAAPERMAAAATLLRRANDELAAAQERVEVLQARQARWASYAQQGKRPSAGTISRHP